MFLIEITILICYTLNIIDIIVLEDGDTLGFFDILKGKNKKAKIEYEVDFTSSVQPDKKFDEQIYSTPTRGVKELQGDYAKTIFLWNQGRKPSPVKKRDEYPEYFFYECGIQNAPKYHKELIDDGYFEYASIKDNLATLKVTELKALLQKYGITSKGKKDNLIETIILEIPADKLNILFPQNTFVLSKLGRDFLASHDDYIKLKEHPGYEISHQEYDEAKSLSPSKSFNDICWGIFNQRLYENAEVNGLSRNIYYSMFLLLKEENRRINSLEMLLHIMLMDIDLELKREYTSYKNNWQTKEETLKNFQNLCFVAPGLVKELGYFEDIYTEEYIEHVYSNENSSHLCPQNLFTELVDAIINGTYNEFEFKNKLLKIFNKIIK